MIKAVTHPNSNSCTSYNDRYGYTIAKDFYMINCRVDTLGIEPFDCDNCNSSYCQPYVVGDVISYQFTSLIYNTCGRVNIIDKNGNNIFNADTSYISQSWCENKGVYTINISLDMELIIDENPEIDFSCFKLEFKFTGIFDELTYALTSAYYCMPTCDEYSVVFDSLYANKDCNDYKYSFNNCDSSNGTLTYSNHLRLKGRVYYNAYNFDVLLSDQYKEITKKTEDSYIFECTTQLPEWVVKKFKSCVMGSDIVVRTYKGSTMLNEYTFIVRKGAEMNNDSGIMWNLKQEFLKICEISNLC